MTSDWKDTSQESGVGIRKREATGSRGFFAFALWLLAPSLVAWFGVPVLSPIAEAQTASKSSARNGNVTKRPLKKTARRPAPSSASRSPTSSKAAAKKRSSPGKTTSKRRRAAAPVRRQLRPTPERYGQVQSALAKAGYYQGPANGAWGQSSVEALKQFQEDQGLDPTGKIDALSLIKLNLGPKYDNQASAVTSDE